MNREITASELEIHCLEVFDEVAATGQEVIITKQGKPVARVIPIEPPKSLKRSVKVLGDFVSSIIDPDDWDVNRE